MFFAVTGTVQAVMLHVVPFYHIVPFYLLRLPFALQSTGVTATVPSSGSKPGEHGF